MNTRQRIKLLEESVTKLSDSNALQQQAASQHIQHHLHNQIESIIETLETEIKNLKQLEGIIGIFEKETQSVDQLQAVDHQ